MGTPYHRHFEPPFTASQELYDELVITPSGDLAHKDQNRRPCLPEWPLVEVNDFAEIQKVLSLDLATPRLDDLHPYLNLVATPSGSHILSLVAQGVRGRKVVLTEDPDQHLIWYYDRIFIKPLPRYLTNHSVWKFHLYPTTVSIEELRKNAAGLVRSYAYLIQRRSDYDLALSLKLIAGLKDTDEDFERFLRFIQVFVKDFKDKDLNPRYHYGEMRLSRLNIWTRLSGRGIMYTAQDGQYGAFFSRFLAPFLFAFGTLTVVLTAMSVVVGTLQIRVSETSHLGAEWYAFLNVCIWYSVICMVLAALIVLFFPFGVAALLIREGIFAVKAVYRR